MQSYEEAETNGYFLALPGERIRINEKTMYINRDTMIQDHNILLRQKRITLIEFLGLSSVMVVPASYKVGLFVDSVVCGSLKEAII